MAHAHIKKYCFMALNKEKNLKLYYSIKEVAELFDINESTLRYWEKEFSNLRPKTTASKVRQYTEKDIEEIRLIYDLVKTRGFKIAAARKMINANRADVEENSKMLANLESIKNDLLIIKKQLDDIV